MKIIFIIIILLFATATANAKITQQDIIKQACECYIEGIENCGYSAEMKIFCENNG